MPIDPPSVDSIFLAALERSSPEERAAYLDAACGDDSDLRQRVERLLAAHPKVVSFLESPAPGIAPTIDQPVVEKLGTMIGPYKLREELGEGGMGSVFMATQKEPVRRKVALKVIKPGMDSKQVISRFEAERQALAMMDHPNVARVIDGGTTESGRPYFVMELVNGMPVTGYCDRYRLTTDDRLELFGVVCQAVQHAHQKGIIHRDLKPSNILVTVIDGKAVPKVIDFGIAKATTGSLTEETLVTNLAQMIGTPLYMSPEQAELSGADVDTRSDVYSLGVLLYELLTGTTPFDRDRMSSVSYDEFRQIIREEDPPRPSNRLSTLDAALDTIAEKHHTDPRTLSNQVSGELDWIVMKSLEKDRTRRYESANELAKDVQRYLDDEAVEACPPTAAYRLKKFARRNKVALVTTAVVALALFVGLVGTTWQSMRATRALHGEIEAKNLAKARLEDADTQRQRAEANFELAMRALDEVYLKAIGEKKLLRDETLSPDGELMPSRSEFSDLERELLQKGLSFYDQFAQQNRDNPQAIFETGKALYRVALLHSGLEENNESQEAFAESIARFKHLTEQNPTEPKYFLELGRAYYGQGQLSRWWPSATDTFTEAKDALDRAIELDSGDAEAFHLRSKVRNSLAQYDDAIKDLEAAVRLDPENAELRMDLASLFNLIQDAGHRDYERALEHAKEAVRLTPKDFAARRILADLYESRFDDREAAAALWEESLAFTSEPWRVDEIRLNISVLRDDHRATIENLDRHIQQGGTHPALYLNRAVAYRQLGETDKARVDLLAFEEASTTKPWLYMRAAREYNELGEIAKALACYNKAEELKPNDVYIYEERADILLAQGRFEEALDDTNKAVELAPRRPWVRKRRADAHFHLGHYDEALADLNAAVELNPTDLSNLTWIGLKEAAECPNEEFRTGYLELADRVIELAPESPRPFVVRARIRAAFGRDQEAVKDLQSAAVIMPEYSDRLSRDVISVYTNIYFAFRELGYPKEAVDVFTTAIEAYPGEPEPFHWRGLVYAAQGRWPEASRDYENAVELEQNRVVFWYNLALIHLGGQRADEYRATCAKMLTAFESTESAGDGSRLAWTCALARDAIPDLSKAVTAADLAVRTDAESASYLNTLGAILYRAGRLEEAIERLTEAHNLIEDREAESTSSPAYTWYFLAMAHRANGNLDQAKRWLDEANDWTNKVIREHEEGTATLPWNRRLTLKLLRSEAEKVIAEDD